MKFYFLSTYESSIYCDFLKVAHNLARCSPFGYQWVKKYYINILRTRIITTQNFTGGEILDFDESAAHTISLLNIKVPPNPFINISSLRPLAFINFFFFKNRDQNKILHPSSRRKPENNQNVILWFVTPVSAVIGYDKLQLSTISKDSS